MLFQKIPKAIWFYNYRNKFKITTIYDYFKFQCIKTRLVTIGKRPDGRTSRKFTSPFQLTSRKRNEDYTTTIDPHENLVTLVWRRISVT